MRTKMNYQECIESKGHLRARAEYDNRDSLYVQGVMSLNEALTAFQTFGRVTLVQQYVNGKRVEVWERGKWKRKILERIFDSDRIGDVHPDRIGAIGNGR